MSEFSTSDELIVADVGSDEQEVYDFANDVLSNESARLLIREYMRKNGSVPRARRDIARIIPTIHKKRGGLDAANPLTHVRKALKDLLNDNILMLVREGYYKYAGVTNSDDAAVALDELDQADDDDATLDEMSERAEESGGHQLQVESEYGEGNEALYVYFYPADRQVAKLEGRNRWPCKVGASSGSAKARIRTQLSSVSLYVLPTVGLIINVEDAFSLERQLHAALKEGGFQIPDSIGKEWFNTCPDLILSWYQRYEVLQKQVSELTELL